MTTQETSVVIVMKARDEATKALEGLQQGLGRTSQRIEGTRVSTNEGASAFGLMKGQLLPLIGGLFTATAAFAAIKTAISDVADSSGEAEFTARSMGTAFVINLEKMREEFAPLGEQFKYTESQVEAAFSTLQQESLRADISVKQLSETLNVARRSNLDLMAVAKAHGQEIRGNVDSLRSLTYEYATWESTVKAANETSKESMDIFEKLGYGIRKTAEDIVRHPWKLLVPPTIDKWVEEKTTPGSVASKLVEEKTTPETSVKSGGPGGPVSPDPFYLRLQKNKETPGTVVNLNIGGDLVVDTEERKNQLIREISEGLDQLNRGTK